MKYLVTGGLGFIGSHLCEMLARAGHSLVVLDDLSTGKRENLVSGTQLIEGDICDASVVASALQGMDGCFHLAAIASVERAEKEKEYCHAVNLTGTLHVFNAAGWNIPVVYASSAAVYGDALTPPLDETMDTQPLGAYGADKKACETHARACATSQDLKSVGLRFFNVYGPRQDPHSPYSGVISIFADRLARGESLTLFGDGGQTRDFIYVGDVARALSTSMHALESGRVSCEVMNVCTGASTSIRTFAETLGRVLGVTPEITLAPPRPGDIRHSLGNPAHAKKVLAFTADTSLETGLTQWLGKHDA